ncbi:MAG: chemotaxis protein CheA [Pseudohongiella sp.]|nr:chemotaxis protein CheA [Pseudohongiella sp.]
MNTSNISEIFFTECDELLQDMESKLLGWENADDKEELIDAVFRSVHTIKGSAGIFAYERIVAFTHVAESVLDDVREKKLQMTDSMIDLLLKSKDHIASLLLLVSGAEELDEHTLALAEENLLEALHELLGSESQQSSSAVVEADTGSVVFELQDEHDRVESNNWHISVKFGHDTFRNGMDPLSFLRYLKTMGDIVHVVTWYEDMPDAAEMDAESCYLSFAISYCTDVNKQQIEDVFLFVADDCELHIIPPRERIAVFLDFIEKVTDDSKKLGEILVECGTLTRAELHKVLSIQLRESGEDGSQRKIGEIVVDHSMVSPEVVQAAIAQQIKTKAEKSVQRGSVRVDAEKLDHLINLVGELVIAGSTVQTEARLFGVEKLIETSETLSRLIEDVRDSTLILRMVQIGDSFNRMTRVVRDVSAELGKNIELKISGADTELDKTIVEKISDPLLHLVRNALDHGIEKPDIRVASGKDAKGTLSLNAYHDSGSIVIEVADDGAGLRPELIRQKAISKGLISADQELSRSEIYKLIFEPGFSTAEKVSNISGRGVGMDVVRSNIEALRGSIELDSEEGEGTRISIRLPLTLAIIDGFMTGVGDACYVLPLNMVEECIELKTAEGEDGKKSYISLRGEILPLISLREQFGHADAENLRENVIVVRHGSQRAGFVVDRLIGEFQTVIKPLGAIFTRLSGISGSTILGSGEVALILDAPALIQQVINRDAAVSRRH